MIITCPNCQTKYQVTYEAIGSAGRKVQCASCQKSWQQAAMPDVTTPRKPDLKIVDPLDAESDRLFDRIEEEALDQAIAEEEEAFSGEKPRSIDPVVPAKAKKRESAAELQERQKALSRRQRAMVSRLPMARLRLGARIGGGVVLAAILLVGYFGRVQVVERSPDMAGLYAAIGLGVNVQGLELEGLQSSRSVADGRDVLVVSAQIVGVMAEPVPVPPVLVSLLDATGHTVYEWSVAPRIRDLMAGERATFDTRLPLPPAEASRVRLSFGGTRAAPSGAEGVVTGGTGEVTPLPVAGMHAEPDHAPVAEHGEEAHAPVAAHDDDEHADAAAPVDAHAEAEHGDDSHEAQTPVEAHPPAVHH